jgi:hypothetical protein
MSKLENLFNIIFTHALTHNVNGKTYMTLAKESMDISKGILSELNKKEKSDFKPLVETLDCNSKFKICSCKKSKH